MPMTTGKRWESRTVRPSVPPAAKRKRGSTPTTNKTREYTALGPSSVVPLPTPRAVRSRIARERTPSSAAGQEAPPWCSGCRPFPQFAASPCPQTSNPQNTHTCREVLTNGRGVGAINRQASHDAAPRRHPRPPQTCPPKCDATTQQDAHAHTERMVTLCTGKEAPIYGHGDTLHWQRDPHIWAWVVSWGMCTRAV